MGKKSQPALKIFFVEDESGDTAEAVNTLYVRVVERCLNDSYLSNEEKMLVLDGIIVCSKKG